MRSCELSRRFHGVYASSSLSYSFSCVSCLKGKECLNISPYNKHTCMCWVSLWLEIKIMYIWLMEIFSHLIMNLCPAHVLMYQYACMWTNLCCWSRFGIKDMRTYILIKHRHCAASKSGSKWVSEYKFVNGYYCLQLTRNYWTFACAC